MEKINNEIMEKTQAGAYPLCEMECMTGGECWIADYPTMAGDTGFTCHLMPKPK